MARKVHGRVGRRGEGADGDAALGDLRQVNAMLCEAVACLPKAVTFNEALACALSLVCRRTGWSWGEAWLPTGRAGQLEQAIDPYVASGGPAGFAEAGRHLKFALGEGLPGLCWREQRPVVVGDVAQEPVERFPRRDLARLYGVRTGTIVCPCGLRGGRWVCSACTPIPGTAAIRRRERSWIPRPEPSPG